MQKLHIALFTLGLLSSCTNAGIGGDPIERDSVVRPPPSLEPGLDLSSEGCNGVTVGGSCSGNVATFCDSASAEVREIDCSQYGQVCSRNPTYGFRCTTAQQDPNAGENNYITDESGLDPVLFPPDYTDLPAECGGVDWRGFCGASNTVQRCIIGDPRRPETSTNVTYVSEEPCDSGYTCEPRGECGGVIHASCCDSSGNPPPVGTTNPNSGAGSTTGGTSGGTTPEETFPEVDPADYETGTRVPDEVCESIGSFRGACHENGIGAITCVDNEIYYSECESFVCREDSDGTPRCPEF